MDFRRSVFSLTFFIQINWLPWKVFSFPPPPLTVHPPMSFIRTNARYSSQGDEMWEGDMILTDEQKSGFYNSIFSRNARKDLKSRWPNAHIPFILHKEMIKYRAVIRAGMKMWSDFSCVTFEEIDSCPMTPHLVIKETGTGCNSWVGIFNGTSIAQTVSLDKECHAIPTITHELGHAIGLWHEQDRPDRNDYLNVFLSNMNEADRIYFETANDDVMTYNIPYDYGSIMQYDLYAFSSNGRMTLVPKDPLAEAVMSRAKTPTFNDYKMVNTMYKCENRCGNSSLQCKNGGFLSWNSQKQCFCICPEGFGDTTCETSVPIVPKCSAKYTTPQVLATPNHPNKLPSNEKCVWWIKAPPGKKVQVKFTNVYLLPRYDKTNECVWDSVRIRSGDVFSDDPGFVKCGKELENQVYTSKREDMVIVLTTDVDTYGTGFKTEIIFI